MNKGELNYLDRTSEINSNLEEEKEEQVDASPTFPNIIPA